MGSSIFDGPIESLWKDAFCVERFYRTVRPAPSRLSGDDHRRDVRFRSRQEFLRKSWLMVRNNCRYADHSQSSFIEERELREASGSGLVLR